MTDAQTTTPEVVADETAIARLATVAHAHVNSLGRYDLDTEPPAAGRLRPLRQAIDAAGAEVPSPPLGFDRARR